MITIGKKTIERVILDNLDLPLDDEKVPVEDVAARVRLASGELLGLIEQALIEEGEAASGIPDLIGRLTDLRNANTERARRGLYVSRNEILDAVIRFLETGDLPDELDPY